MTKTAVVTGGGAGIGEAICLRLAREGFAVAILDINGAGAEAVAASIVDSGGQAAALQADVADRESIASALTQARARFGQITALVNNAGVDQFVDFEQISDPDWDRIMEINLKGAFAVTQLVLPDMKAAGWGRIVNLASQAAQTGAGRMVHYAASKGGIVAMTRSLAIELGASGITVNAVSPGFIDTPMARRAIDAGEFPIPPEQLVQHFSVPRMGRPEEVAAACAYFLSDDAGYTTGQLLGINGGTAT